MKKLIISLIILIVIGLGILFIPNEYVKITSKKYVDTNIEEEIDCILVLGAGVWGDEPSPMLKDRLDRAIELYKSGKSIKIIMSGDHGKEGYDEVNIMKRYAIKEGIPSENIFMDHAGFSTYDSMYRAKYIFGVKNIIVVSQEYHLYRAIYIAHKLGINAYGVSAEHINYSGQLNREIREMLARDKDFFKVIFKPKSTYLGEEISLDGSGDVTND